MCKGDAPEALRLVDLALAVSPDLPAALYNRAVLLRALGKERDAEDSARRATEADPNLAEAWDLRAQIASAQGAVEEASACHARALQIQPQNAHFIGHAAVTLATQGRLKEALAAARHAEKIDPSWPPMALGNMLKACGYPAEAATRFAKLRAMFPHSADAAASEAMAYLQQGDFDKGLPLWEQRPDFRAALDGMTLWQGEWVDTLYMYEDQGLGDALCFLRYLPLLRERVGRVCLSVPEPLYQLCGENWPDMEIGFEVKGEGMPPALLQGISLKSARCRLSSLPFHFSTRVDTIPSAPYLKAAPEKRALWHERLEKIPKPRIGVVWAGNASFKQDQTRSLPPALLPDFLAGLESHSVLLQKDRDALPIPGLFDAAPFLSDFADTAALLSELDLLISVDTAPAHLAGALGVPLWLLVPFDPDWRWFLNRSDSPWYPSARLFRQPEPMDWGSVLAEVKRRIQIIPETP